jgi:hypothetical protein
LPLTPHSRQVNHILCCQNLRKQALAIKVALRGIRASGA